LSGEISTTSDLTKGEAARRSPFCLVVLKTRPLFKAASSGPRYSTDGFAMQRRLPLEGEVLAGHRFGFTVTKKIGNAVLRNRIRRRLRAAVVEAGPALPMSALDLVLVAREPAATLPFTTLVADIIRAAKVLSERNRPSRGPKMPR
jgi:ribonuclease P protein component